MLPKHWMSLPAAFDSTLAYEGGSNFMSRLAALAERKARAEEALAELKLGKAAKEAFGQAKAALADADKKGVQAAELCAKAESVLRQALADAGAVAQKSKTEHDALIAEARRIRDEAEQTKAAADRDLAAALEDRNRLAAERASLKAQAEQAEAARQRYEAGFAEVRAGYDMLLNAQSVMQEYVEAIEDMRKALDRREAIFARLAVDLAAGLAH